MADDGMVTKFVAFCPLGDTCAKKGRRLGAYDSFDQAREQVVWHLKMSSYHGLSDADADAASYGECIVEEQWPNEAAEHAEQDDRGKGNKTRDYSRKGKGKGYQSARPAPYHCERQPQQRSSEMEVLVAVPSAKGLTEVVAAIARSEAAARTAARMARAAAQAFDEEAAVMQVAMMKLSPKGRAD